MHTHAKVTHAITYTMYPMVYFYHLAARGYSHKFVSKYVKTVSNQQVSLASAMDGGCSASRNSASPKKEQFIAWFNLQGFAECVVDFMSNEECIVLPYSKFEGVFLVYRQDMERRKENRCQSSYACRIFSEEFSHIR